MASNFSREILSLVNVHCLGHATEHDKYGLPPQKTVRGFGSRVWMFVSLLCVSWCQFRLYVCMLSRCSTGKLFDALETLV